MAVAGNVELRSFGRSGLKVSALSLGAMTFGESTTFMKGATSDDGEARRVFDMAVERGVNLIDTANVYSEGRSETLVGQWAAGKRDNLLIATKCRFPIGFGMLEAGTYDQGLSRKAIVQACEASLKRLGSDYIDLYQVHMQDTDVPVDETLRALDDLMRAGKIRYAGCSNYTGYRLVESLWAADRGNMPRYASVQFQWSLAMRDAEREIVPACKAFELGTMAWSPLAGGFLTGKYQRGQAPSEGSRLSSWKDTFARFDKPRYWELIDLIGQIAKAHETTHAAVAIAWLLAQGVSTVIVGARSTDQLEANFSALEVSLSSDELSKLDEASRPSWGYPYSFIGRLQSW